MCQVFWLFLITRLPTLFATSADEKQFIVVALFISDIRSHIIDMFLMLMFQALTYELSYAFNINWMNSGTYVVGKSLSLCTRYVSKY